MRKKNHNKLIIKFTMYFWGVVIFLYVLLVRLTSKIEYENEQQKTNSHIYLFWHGKMFAPFLYRKFMINPSILVSDHKMLPIFKLLGNFYKTRLIIRNKKNNKIQTIMQVYKQIAKNQGDILIATEGSIGPYFKVHNSVYKLYNFYNKNTLHITFSAKRILMLNSWDKFQVILPFNKIIVKSYTLPENLNPDELENMLQKQSWDIDKNLNIPTNRT